jgi:hypothetical protein
MMDDGKDGRSYAVDLRLGVFTTSLPFTSSSPKSLCSYHITQASTMVHHHLILRAVLFSIAAITGFVQSFTPLRVCQQQTLTRYRGLARASSTGALFAGDASPISREDELMSVLSDMNINRNKEVHSLPCGLDCTDKERDVIRSLISELELEPTNVVKLRNGKIAEKELMGEWDLLYTSSRTMIINNGLSGLGRSTSAFSEFVSLRKKLTGSKFLGTCEYIETLGTGPESFDVIISGEWMLKGDTNPFTNAPATVLCVDHETVVYAIGSISSTNKADDWDSLGPMKRTDIIYMKDKLLIARGSSSTDALFVFQRIAN